ncbi:transmembrane protein 70, mitochondrial-like [Antedon mediterranea]|uniref:transmembrane protein 70, mitochondrial-like n=1 Tax=Antedon mediterranea TaxID=105859 RepID=UPI003AF9E546
MYLASSLNTLCSISRSTNCCYSSFQAAKLISNLNSTHKTIATCAALKDRWSDPTSEYFKDRLVKKENVDRLIYKFRSGLFLRLSNVFFYGTACLGLYLAPDIILGTLEHTSFNFETFANVAGITISTLVIPTTSRIFTKRVVLKLYHNSSKDTYVAHVFTPFLLEKKIHFHSNDVVPSKKNLFFNLTTLRAKDYPMFYQPYRFVLPSDFNHLMGFDKF